MRRVARAEQGVRTAAEPTETVASTSRTVERHRVSAIATGGRVVGPRRYRSASAIARSLRQASATASPRARAASSCTSAGSRRSKKRRFLQNRDCPRSGLAHRAPGGSVRARVRARGTRARVRIFRDQDSSRDPILQLAPCCMSAFLSHASDSWREAQPRGPATDPPPPHSPVAGYLDVISNRDCLRWA